jgi:beta-lactam-binding protein with PASTA domain/tRNA A-37 threonylcarbamoyl transferase component Bud32
MVGKMIGNRYEIITRIGVGGMANVYQARCTILNRIVTVKVLRSELAEDKDFVRRFQLEAQAVASLSHPNIVSIYDVGEEDGLPYLVMEYVEGANLKEIIKNRGPLSPSEAVNIGIQVCAALAHAHSKGIIHRDIKPHNILVTPGGRVKVTDFGLARVLSMPSATMTQSGTVMGSVHYFSPEQARGEEATPQSDLYSLGVVLYETLSGEVPFQGDNPVSIALKHLQEEPTGLRLKNPEIPSELEDIILKAMSKDPAKRFVSAREMQRALSECFISDDELEAEEQTQFLPAVDGGNKKRKGRLHPAALAAIIILGLCLLVGIVWGFTNWYFGEPIAVPNVVGDPEDVADAKLRDAGLRVEVNETYDQGSKKGIVVQQQPEAGMKVKKGRTVQLWVNKGQTLVWLPEITGTTERDAQITLETRGFQVKILKEYSEDIPAGHVIRQLPAGDQNYPKGSTVTLVVSKGPAPRDVPVPSLIGLSIEQAKIALDAVGLVLGEPSEEYSDKEQGVIIRQTIEPGTMVRKGDVVDVVVSSGPEPQKVRFEVHEPGEVKVVIQDTTGTRVVYQQMHQAGDRVEVPVQVLVPGVIQVFFQGQLVESYDVK